MDALEIMEEMVPLVDQPAARATFYPAAPSTDLHSELYFKGLTGVTNGVTDGVANVYFYDPMEPATPGGAVQLEQTVLPNTEHVVGRPNHFQV